MNDKDKTESPLKLTEEQLASLKCVLAGISPCCNAPIDDESFVFNEGAHKGHGWRICSKCKKGVWRV